MHCPRCGAKTEKGDRFCASCGATLTPIQTPQRSFRERVAELIGTTRRVRIVTTATVVAIAVAIVAFFFLPAEEEGIPRDEYTVAADEICVEAKQEIASLGGGPPPPDRFARELVRILAEWRSLLGDLDPPDARRAELAERLDEALLEVEVEAGAMARAAREDDRELLLERAVLLEAASGRVEAAIDSLGLESCAGLGFVPRAAPESD